MATATPSTTPRLRLWPGVVIVVVLWATLIVAQNVELSQEAFMARMFGPMIAGLLVVVWWMFASRLPWRDRLLTMTACIVLGAGAFFLFDPSVGVFGLVMSAVPAVLAAWVGWLCLSIPLSWPARRAGLIVVLGLAWGYHTLLRFEGADGDMKMTNAFRWTPTAEDLYLADQSKRTPSAVVAAPAVIELAPGDWPEFRGPNRDSRVPGVRLTTDFQKNPPKQVWRHRVGPGWSSFAVVGNRVYTQEQRDTIEVVVCLNASTGQEIWAHTDEARFTEAVAGPGPRATPTFHAGKIYALGAAGRLNCLDAATGKKIWSQDVAKDSGSKDLVWGFAASPLVAKGIVSVYAGGPDGKAVLAYDAASGDLKWKAGEGTHGYCSTQLFTVAGVEQLLVCTNVGMSSFDPVSGKVLWHHEWPYENMCRVVQPCPLSDTDFLIGTGLGMGTRRIHVERDGESWKTSEVWTTKSIKPYYNDFLVHKGHIYGFDSGFLVCVNLETQKLHWKVRGYGSGQALLLPDQDMLLVLTEKGEVSLVACNPAEHQQVSKFTAIEGKTWNHPVLVRGKLFVRNGEEAACYEVKE